MFGLPPWVKLPRRSFDFFFRMGRSNFSRLTRFRMGQKKLPGTNSLKENGFIPAYDGDSDIYYKVVDGVCRSFDKTDAVSDDSVSVTFFVGDYDKRAEERERKAEAAREAAESAKEAAREAAETAKDTAKAAADKAKGLFKKFF